MMPRCCAGACDDTGACLPAGSPPLMRAPVNASIVGTYDGGKGAVEALPLVLPLSRRPDEAACCRYSGVHATGWCTAGTAYGRPATGPMTA
mmetsp:Transcript_51492/g.71459  ORF Transcript_51492/g.71459 Transcript_51492/m.71459 type:complete len:91 (-) Transcript_51492:294-566(-)